MCPFAIGTPTNVRDLARRWKVPQHTVQTTALPLVLLLGQCDARQTARLVHLDWADLRSVQAACQAVAVASNRCTRAASDWQPLAQRLLRSAPAGFQCFLEWVS